ncbi:phosphoribosylformylglycinamidine synthase [Chytridium lagenaria]|nr:phosphoribosylformylglycinamidine synthase [Chytridium lagenaria]
MGMLFGKPPRMHRVDETRTPKGRKVAVPGEVAEIGERVLRTPSVGSKSFLITIGDRTVTGLIGRDQMVGPWQVPVADVSVTLTSYQDNTGEAMSMGERTPLALLSPAASARMAVAESLTNLLAAPVATLSEVRLSANWMCAASHPGEGSGLYEAVKAVGMDLCPKLGITIPVGKDSMSMKTRWTDEGGAKEVTAPVSLIVTAYAPVDNSSATFTPELVREEGTVLLFCDLANGATRLGGSVLAQVYNQVGDIAPDVDHPELLQAFTKALKEIRGETGKPLILAYHDRSDGGLFTTVLEMCFAGHVGCNIDISSYSKGDAIAALFNEELGVVLQVALKDVATLRQVFAKHGFPETLVHVLGNVASSSTDIRITANAGRDIVFEGSRIALHRAWAETSYRMQALRGDPDVSLEEFNTLLDVSDPGLNASIPFDVSVPPVSLIPGANVTNRPRVAVLREQGINSHGELAYAFHAAGFEAVDVHMTEILSGKISLEGFVGLGMPGGFSYGDVLGAGAGWAKSILMNPVARRELQTFFNREDTFTIGICNGCQALTQLKELIPGAEAWPAFVKNRSEMFEARVCTVEVLGDGGVFFGGMKGARIPIAVAHGEGRAEFDGVEDVESVVGNGGKGSLALRYVDHYGAPAGPGRYPFNPNGSPLGVAGVLNGGKSGGRILALMPHPERFVTVNANTWALPRRERVSGEKVNGPWVRMFENARAWVEKNKIAAAAKK